MIRCCGSERASYISCCPKDTSYSSWGPEGASDSGCVPWRFLQRLQASNTAHAQQTRALAVRRASIGVLAYEQHSTQDARTRLVYNLQTYHVIYTDVFCVFGITAC